MSEATVRGYHATPVLLHGMDIKENPRLIGPLW